MLIAIRAESPLFGSESPGAPDVRDKTTSLRNVGPSANSTLIRYSSHRLWLSRLIRDRE